MSRSIPLLGLALGATALLFGSAARVRASTVRQAVLASSQGQQHEQRLSGIIRAAREAIVVVDDEQSIMIFNPMAEKLFDCPASDAIGSSLVRFIPARFRAGHHDHVRRFGQTGVSEREMGGQRRLYGLNARGEEFPIEASISQHQDTHTGVKLYTVMLRDISERVRIEDALRTSREELQQLSGSIQAAREAEKTRIARELHDDLGQQLTALKMDVTILEDELRAGADQPVLLSHLNGMYDLIDATVASVRRIAADLRPVMLDDLGLGPAIEWLVNDFSHRYRMQVDAQIDADAIDFTAERATAVFRIIQEGLTNIARHAHATQVTLDVARQDGCCVVAIGDNGRGASLEGGRPHNSFGLLGVRERARLLGGDVVIESSPGNGFLLTVKLPLPMAATPEQPS